jgi:hypothetical protein
LGRLDGTRPKANVTSQKEHRVGARTDFEIVHEDRGFMVVARTSWWADDGAGAVGTAGGIAQSIPFASPADAIAWVAEQFSVEPDAWVKRTDGVLLAEKDRPPPERRKRTGEKSRRDAVTAA